MELNRNKNNEGTDVSESYLYGITGMFGQIYTNYQPIAFGGYVLFDTATSLLRDGQLIDPYGPSVIKGRLEEDTLEFEKRYVCTEKNVNRYSFNKKGDLWIGRWEQFEGYTKWGEGPAQCKIFLVDKEYFNIICEKPKIDPY